MSQDINFLPDMKVQIATFKFMHGFGDAEAKMYMKALLCKDKVTFFGPMRHDAFIKFQPWESEAYWQEFPSYDRFVTNRGWWRWIDDFKPDDNIEHHRYLFDPMGNVFDAKSCHAAEVKAKRHWKKALERTCYDYVVNPCDNTETGYIRYQFARVTGKPKNITRSRLIAYRYPHLVWHDYAKERYGLENFLAAPFAILLDVMGYDEEGNMTSTGFYNPFLNDVAERYATSDSKGGKVKTHQPKGPSGAGTLYACSPIEIDHINRDHTDDRPTNLRITDRMGNLLNSGDNGFRNYGLWLKAQYEYSLQTGVLPAVKIITD